MTLEDWADCPIAGCKHKVCLALNSKWCYPHTVEFNGGIFHSSVNIEIVNCSVQTVDNGAI